MLAAIHVGNIGILELAILFAAIAYVTQLVLDALGISRTSRTLRTENEDLLRRNGELDGAVTRLKHEVARLEGELGALRAQVAELSQRDQLAVLAALEQHERHASERHLVSTELLREVVGELKQIREAA